MTIPLWVGLAFIMGVIAGSYTMVCLLKKEITREANEELRERISCIVYYLEDMHYQGKTKEALTKLKEIKEACNGTN